MNKLKAIIFDMDGTLANTEELHRQAFNEAFVEFGYDWQWSKNQYIELLSISGGQHRISHFIQLKETGNGTSDYYEQRAKTIHQRKSEIYRDKLAKDISLRSGVERLINQVREEGLRMAISTSSSQKNVEALLHNTLGDDALNWFDTIVTCELVPAQKPAPDHYHMVLSNLNLDAKDCIAIEDSYNGNLSALAAGLKTVITVHDLTIDNDFHGASLVLDKLGEPTDPFTVISGETQGANYVDITLLKNIVSPSSDPKTKIGLKVVSAKK